MFRLHMKVQSGEDAGKLLRLDPPGGRLGRNSECELFLRDGAISAHHAEFVTTDGYRWLVRDLESRNGTRLNGQPVGQDACELPEEGRISFATVELEYWLDPIPRREVGGAARPPGQLLPGADMTALMTVGAAAEQSDLRRKAPATPTSVDTRGVMSVFDSALLPPRGPEASPRPGDTRAARPSDAVAGGYGEAIRAHSNVAAAGRPGKASDTWPNGVVLPRAGELAAAQLNGVAPGRSGEAVGPRWNGVATSGVGHADSPGPSGAADLRPGEARNPPAAGQALAGAKSAVGPARADEAASISASRQVDLSAGAQLKQAQQRIETLERDLAERRRENGWLETERRQLLAEIEQMRRAGEQGAAGTGGAVPAGIRTSIEEGLAFTQRFGEQLDALAEALEALAGGERARSTLRGVSLGLADLRTVLEEARRLSGGSGR